MYAGMGGFVFDMDVLPQGDDAFIPARQRLTLTAPGVILLAKCGYLPDLSIKEIRDKSKADGLAKALVCLQAGWMVVQTVGRLIQEQAVTLLEVNTLGHVFCAFVIYLLWWQKPREVYEPTVIQGESMNRLCAYYYMSSRVSARKPNRRVKLDSWKTPELARLAWYPEHRTPAMMALRRNQDSSSGINCHSPCAENRSSEMIIEEVRADREEMQGELASRPEFGPDHPETIIKRSATIERVPVKDDTPHKQTLRTQLAAQAVRNFEAVRERFTARTTKDENGDGIAWLEPKVEQLVVTTAGDWPSDHYLPGIAGELMGMALWFASMGYGAVHAAAWRDAFPSEAERLIWRFSSVYITCSGALWFAMCMIGYRFPWASAYWDRLIALQGWWFEYAFFGIIATICGVAYIFARVFLVVDAFVSLRALPASAYETPNWSSLIPHL